MIGITDMKQKTYTFKRPDGSDLVKTLAHPTNKNIVAMLKLLGAQNFSDLFGDGALMAAAVKRLDIGVDLKQLEEALDICLIEGSEGIGLETLDLRDSDRAIQDFFDQRSKSLSERQNT